MLQMQTSLYDIGITLFYTKIFKYGINPKFLIINPRVFLILYNYTLFILYKSTLFTF